MDTSTIIVLILVGVVVLVAVLAVFYLILSAGAKKKKKEEELKNPVTYKGMSPEEAVKTEGMSAFLDFDEVKDNMIIRKNRTQYIMVIQCQGVNYDLLSEDEKLAVENGFVQFLNTLRFPIQLYVQTRSLNLKDIIEEYKSRMQAMQEDLNKLKMKLEQAKKVGSLDTIEKIEYEIRRKENVLEYGMDISEYIARLSLNNNILQQKTYVILSYYAAELGDINNFSREELDGMCFSELYTKAQSIMRTLTSSEVYSKILTSEELAELLYIAYNRSESEALQLRKALEADYESLYSTGKDILVKKQQKLDEQIEIEAIDLATESILAADRKRQEEEEEKEKRVRERAAELLDTYKEQMEPELYEEAKKQVEKPKRKRTVKKKAV